MRPGQIVLVVAVAVASALAVMVVMPSPGQQQSGQVGETLTFLGKPVAAEQIEEGRQLYAVNCASCHGANLEGQANWKRRLPTGRMPAPPHDETGHTWHHADQDLFTITKHGVEAVVPGYESDMTAFDGILSDDEISAVLAYIKTTWPDRQRAIQTGITANNKGKS